MLWLCKYGWHSRPSAADCNTCPGLGTVSCRRNGSWLLSCLGCSMITAEVHSINGVEKGGSVLQSQKTHPIEVQLDPSACKGRPVWGC